MKKPLVSYVVTAYNIEDFIEESVKCAFAQTYDNLEIVLSDDHSSDHTFDIMKRLADEYQGPHKVVLNRNEENLGITKHMNKCYIDLAKGEIIVAAHGDDVSDPERTSITVEFLLNNKDVSQVACSATAVDKDLNVLPSIYQSNLSVDEIHYYDINSFGHVSVGFSTFRKRVMSVFNYISDTCPTEDDIIGIRAILEGKVVFLPNKLVLYRKHENAFSNPEKFDQFPLDKIYEQKCRDIDYASSEGIIDKTIAEEFKIRLYKENEIRKDYREYFSKRTNASLLKLITNKYLNLHTRLSFIKQHILFMLNSNS